MSRRYRVAIVGATGLVGQTIMKILEERDFPIEQAHLLASSRSAGKTLSFMGRDHTVEDLAGFDFSGVDIGLFSPGGAVSGEYAPKAAAAGCVVIDNTSKFRYDDDVPLVVPEVNPEAIAGYTKKNIIANPNCSTIVMLMAIKPLHDAAGITRINVATYQAVSGAGSAALEELDVQARAVLDGEPVKVEIAPRQIAFNCIPQVDSFQDNGYTREEMKMVWETHKILGDESIGVNPTAARVGVHNGHSEAVHLETREKLTAAQARDMLSRAPGVVLMDDPEAGSYPTAASDADGRDAVFVGRVREDLSHPHGLALWVVGDNIRKGAALNTVQIAELLVKDYL